MNQRESKEPECDGEEGAWKVRGRHVAVGKQEGAGPCCMHRIDHLLDSLEPIAGRGRAQLVRLNPS